MTVISAATIDDHIDFLIMQPDHEQAIVRDLVFAVLAFNKQARGEPLQISFPLYADPKVTTRAALGPCVRITGPAEKLYVLTLRYEVAAHLRAGRAMTLVRDRVVVEAGRNERFALVSSNRPRKARSIAARADTVDRACDGAAARAVGPFASARDRGRARRDRARRGRVHRARGERGRKRRRDRSARLLGREDGAGIEALSGYAR